MMTYNQLYVIIHWFFGNQENKTRRITETYTISEKAVFSCEACAGIIAWLAEGIDIIKSAETSALFKSYEIVRLKSPKSKIDKLKSKYRKSYFFIKSFPVIRKSIETLKYSDIFTSISSDGSLFPFS